MPTRRSGISRRREAVLGYAI